MLRHLFAAAIVMSARLWAQDMPVTRLAGGGQPPARVQPPSAPARPAGALLPPLPVTQIDPRDAAASLDRQSGLSLSFADPMPIADVMRLLVEGTPFSLAIDPDAVGSFRGELKRLTLRESLATLLTPLGLDFEVQGTIIRVMRRRAETRQFDLNVLNVQRGMQRTSSNGDGSAVITTTVNPDDVFAGVSAGVRSLLSETGRLNIDRRSGLALVSDYPERLDRVAAYLESLHARSARQVRLEAVVFEVTLRDGASIDWRLVREKLGLRGNAPEAGIAADPLALRGALAAQGDIQDLWAPAVTTLNNEAAMVHVSTAGSTALTMTVLPQISADGFVQLDVSHAWAERDGVSASDSISRVTDGQTVLVAGLVRPRNVGSRRSQVELVVLLKPTIVRAGASTAAGSRQ